MCAHFAAPAAQCSTQTGLSTFAFVGSRARFFGPGGTAEMPGANRHLVSRSQPAIRPRSRKPCRDWRASRPRITALCPHQAKCAHMLQEASVNWATHQPLVEILWVWLRRHSHRRLSPQLPGEGADQVRRARGAKLRRPKPYFLALSTLNISKPSAGLRFSCTTAWTALIIA